MPAGLAVSFERIGYADDRDGPSSFRRPEESASRDHVARPKTGSTAKVATCTPSEGSASSTTAAPIFHVAQASGRIGRNPPEVTGTLGRTIAPAV